MESVYDWVTLSIFAGLIVLFLQRSMSEGEPGDSIWQYLGAMVGCAVSDYLGNQGLKAGTVLLQAIAVVGILGTLLYVYVYLRPFDRTPRT